MRVVRPFEITPKGWCIGLNYAEGVVHWFEYAKAFANFSPGLERQRQPWDRTKQKP